MLAGEKVWAAQETYPWRQAAQEVEPGKKLPKMLTVAEISREPLERGSLKDPMVQEEVMEQKSAPPRPQMTLGSLEGELTVIPVA